MDPSFDTVLVNLAAAWLAGSVIGLERTFHGRPAGFRTHALVALASAVLMILPYVPWGLVGGHAGSDLFRSDPMRLAQGIMTGIGFLGAGVIYKDGFSVRGLTTAASIWITAAIGLLFGGGLLALGTVATIATLGTLALFRVLEDRMPQHTYSKLSLVFPRAGAPDDPHVRDLVAGFGFKIDGASYGMDGEAGSFTYDLIISTTERGALERLIAAMRERPDLIAFRLSPSGE